MRKFLLTLTTLCIALFTQAQDVNTMYIYRNNGNIEEIPVTDIDSITFTKPATSTPDVPTEPDQPAITAGEAIDLGLSVKWAGWNVGASSPEEYGDYYAWGETSTKNDYSWSTYKYCNGSYDTMTKYCTDSDYGTVDNKTTLEPNDDVARVKWGGSWRMPTRAEQDELREKCTWEWTTYKGVNGYKVTGPNGNSIFLPAAGYRYGTEVTDRGSYGYYWSSSLDSSYSYYACNLCFTSSYSYWHSYSRYYGRTVRPVCE